MNQKIKRFFIILFVIFDICFLVFCCLSPIFLMELWAGLISGWVWIAVVIVCLPILIAFLIFVCIFLGFSIYEVLKK